MVKVFYVLIFLCTLVFSDDINKEDLLIQKIKTLLDASVYKQNSAYINIIFSPKSDYYIKERVDVVKVVETLKENGLLNLFYKNPSELKLSFKTSGSPLFFVKIMGDTLSNIGYYRYVTTESTLDNSEFTWTISLTSEYATDPLILQKELQKSGCELVDIKRNSSVDWTYTVDMREGHLSLETLTEGAQVNLKRSLYAHWLNVSKIQTLKITSSSRNDWYPYIVYYDSSLHLLKVLKRDTKRDEIILNIPKFAEYMKISDLYTLKNIKDDLVLKPMGAR
ncbi:hypothetical protein KKG72_01995 [bacterium]|nr:hypothetical protein [bacterium]MBU1993250.1 hypothetical protein [bacterium]